MSTSMRLKLLGIFNLSFTLETKTGLLIRSGKGKEILGGVDIQPMAVEFNYGGVPITVPYMPGSSLKGRARSLLELALGLELRTTDNKIFYHMRVVKQEIKHLEPYCPVDNIFGSASVQPNLYLGEGADTKFRTFVEKCWAPTRAIFRDLFPSADYVKKLMDEKGSVAFEDFLEEKWENRIDRVTSAADPRNVLRVKPGVPFEGEVEVLVFDIDVCDVPECRELSQIKPEYPAKYYMERLLDSLKLVEDTYLGASGTRGYGKVKFGNLKVEFYDLTSFERNKITEANDLLNLKNGLLKHDVWNKLREKCKSTTS